MLTSESMLDTHTSGQASGAPPLLRWKHRTARFNDLRFGRNSERLSKPGAQLGDSPRHSVPNREIFPIVAESRQPVRLLLIVFNDREPDEPAGDALAESVESGGTVPQHRVHL